MRIDSALEGGVEPVPPQERVQSLDVLRGLALFGILLVNILDYAPAPSSTADWLTSNVIKVLADGSFYPLFSLLFGVGFAVFLDRAASRGANGVLLYLRRLIALLAIAVLQIILLEDRNILVRYAFLALPLLLFWRASARACFAGAMICGALAVARVPLTQTLAAWESRNPVVAAQLRQQREADQILVRARQAEWQRVKATQSFLQTASFRTRWQVPSALAWSMNLRRNPTLFHILAMFLLGAAAWRSRIFVEPQRYRRLMTRVLAWGLPIGLVGNVALSMGPEGGPVSIIALQPLIIVALTVVANTAMTLAYAAAILLLWWSGANLWRRQLVSLAWIGRMGLTNYLWQSLAMSLLFLPYGLRLDGKFALWVYPLIAVVIFLSHMPFSIWWLARYRFGPVEWLWRSVTYWQVQPMRLPHGKLELAADKQWPKGRSTA